jgi:crossover junction endodeoxyribonuclease RuvC
MEKIILGIDPGTNIMGYGLLKVVDGKAQMITMGVIDLRKFPDAYMKLGHIFERVTGIIDGYLPDEMAIEAPFFGKNVQSMLKLGRAQGVAIAAALSRDLSYTEYEPSVIKQLVTGNGNASKEQVATMLRSILGFDDDPKYLDATDALAVAYTCHMQFSNPLGDLRSQLMPKTKRTKSRKKQWAEFVNQNPDIVN